MKKHQQEAVLRNDLQQAEPSRRSVIKAAAWSMPVIALAVSAPAAAASGPTPPTAYVTCGADAMNDNGTYTVTKNDNGTTTITVIYKTAPDIYEINVRTTAGNFSYGTNYGSAPMKGSTSWTIVVPAKVTWAQVHSFNSHFGEATCSAPTDW